jgi:dGTPase
VRNAPQLIAFSDAMAAEAAVLKKFLREKLYRHYQVNRMTAKARRIIAEMFQAFIGQPSLLPPDYQVKGITDETSASTSRRAKWPTTSPA